MKLNLVRGALLVLLTAVSFSAIASTFQIGSLALPEDSKNILVSGVKIAWGPSGQTEVVDNGSCTTEGGKCGLSNEEIYKYVDLRITISFQSSSFDPMKDDASCSKFEDTGSNYDCTHKSGHYEKTVTVKVSQDLGQKIHDGTLAGTSLVKNIKVRKLVRNDVYLGEATPTGSDCSWNYEYGGYNFPALCHDEYKNPKTVLAPFTQVDITVLAK